jgi:hypothetical protein
MLTWISAGSVGCYPCRVTSIPDNWTGIVWYPIHPNNRVRNYLSEEQWRNLWLPAKRGWARERPMVLTGDGQRLLSEWDAKHGQVSDGD